MDCSNLQNRDFSSCTNLAIINAGALNTALGTVTAQNQFLPDNYFVNGNTQILKLPGSIKQLEATSFGYNSSFNTIIFGDENDLSLLNTVGQGMDNNPFAVNGDIRYQFYIYVSEDRRNVSAWSNLEAGAPAGSQFQYNVFKVTP